MEEKTIYQLNDLPLIKFQKAEIIEKLQHGQFYVKTLDYYRKLEQETGDADIGDAFEAMLPVDDVFVLCHELGVNHIDHGFLRTEESDDFVFCMFSPQTISDSFEFTDNQKEKMGVLGDTALVILDREEFKRRVFTSIESRGYEVYYSQVYYFEENKTNLDFYISLLHGMWNIAFWKRMRYSYQSEGRFVIRPNRQVEDHIIFEIGDISDISIVITLEQALNGIIQR